MNALLEKYNDYMRLKDCRAEYNLENGVILQFVYDEKAFAHLLGLHKLTDLQLIQFWLDKHNRTVKLEDVIRKIKNSTFTDANVQSSTHYSKIQDRYDNFNYDNLTALNYTDAIIDFDPTIMGSILKSDYLLFEEKGNNKYNHLAIAKDSSGKYRYVESFFHEPSNSYLSGQTIVKINHFQLYDSTNTIIVADSF